MAVYVSRICFIGPHNELASPDETTLRGGEIAFVDLQQGKVIKSPDELLGRFPVVLALGDGASRRGIAFEERPWLRRLGLSAA